MPIKFWTSTAGIRTPLVNDLCPYPFEIKDPLFESMFSVIIENTKVDNYFSEKLLDALRTYTVPIYFGCPNILEYFEEDGMINVNSIEELVSCVNSLTPDDYWKRMGSLVKNFTNAENFINYGERMKQVIIAAFVEKNGPASAYPHE